MSEPIFTQVERSVAELEPNAINPRTLKDKAFKELQQSLEKDPHFLKARPIIVSMAEGREGTVIAGNQRLAAAKALGWATVPVVEVRDASVEQEKEWMVKDNLHKGEWDFDKLAEGFDLDFLKDMGFDEKELNKVLANVDNSADDEFDAEKEAEAITEPIVKRGDIWQLGEHRLMCGDSTDAGDVALLMDGKKADMVFTDPPYNTGMTGETQGDGKLWRGDGKKAGSTRLNHMFNDSYTEEEWENFMASFVARIAESLQEDSVAYVCLDWRRNYELIPHLKEHFHLSNTIVWDKVVHGLGSDYKYTYELINVCKKGKPVMDTHQGDEAEYSDVWHIQRKIGKDKDHATKKPIELITRPIKHACPIDGVVLDIFGGSGSTLIACEQMERTCYMMEIDPKYCDVIIKRWEEKTGTKASKISS